MDRQRRQQADAAAVLHSALVCLNRGGACREPLTPSMFARPNPKGLQAVLYLLYLRIRGTARTKKELQHVYPVLEPAQAKEFKAAMHAWIRELGAAGAVGPDTVKYFVSAYQGSSSLRTVLMLLDLCAVALAKELGADGPHASLPGARGMHPGAAGTGAAPNSGPADQAASVIRRGQARLDAVVAAMQRLKQLHTQAVGHLAGGQAASGAPQQLARHIPPLFSASQASIRRGDVVHELLAQGPQLTGKPEAVCPDSWADLLAVGKSAAAVSGAAASPLLARRLSNPVQEASNFAAEGLAADADVLAVHHVLARRLAASGAVLQAAAEAGSAVGSSEVRTALADAAACREALLLSVRQELAAAKVRAEMLAGSGASRPPLLRLLPPSQPPRNPVLEGVQAAQEAAAVAPAADGASASCGWCPPEAATVQALRRSMWQRLKCSSAGSSRGASACCSSGAEPSPAVPDSAQGVAAAGTDPNALVDVTAAPASPLCQAALESASHGASCSKAAHTCKDEAPAHGSSLSAGMPTGVGGALAVSPLPTLRGKFDAAAHPEEERQQRGTAKPVTQRPQQHGSEVPFQQQLSSRQPHAPLPTSPCMAESCASVSVVAENHGSSWGADAGAGHRAGVGRLLPLAASPMVSAAASIMPARLHFHDDQQQRQQGPRQPQQSRSQRHSSGSDACVQSAGRATAAPGAHLPPRLQLESQSPDAGEVMHRTGSSDSPPGQAAAASSRRRAASLTFTVTPPKRMLDSPLLHVAPGQGGAATPTSHMLPGTTRFGGGGAADKPPALPSLVLQPVQPRQQHPRLAQQASPMLLASCFKSRPEAQSPLASPLAGQLSSPLAGGKQPQARWALTPGGSTPRAGHTGSPIGSAGSAGGSVGRRRSTLHTTSSPACRDGAHPAQSASPLFTPPRSLMDTPGGPSLASRLHDEVSNQPSADGRAHTAAAASGATARGGGTMEELRQRLRRVQFGHGALG